MSLTSERLTRLQRSLELALNQEWPQLTQTQRRLARIPVRTISASQPGQRSPVVVATVATDGGESRLKVEPIRVQVIRVADSQGEIYFEDFIPQSLRPEEIFRFFFQAEPRLQKFLDYLGVKWDALLPRSDFQHSQLLEMMRELMEWAALLKLASQPSAKLLIRDGLLRSVLLPNLVFQSLLAKFQAFTTQHGHWLVGVAKRSRVINYLSMALGLAESFAGEEPAYLQVPAELEREAAPSQYRWIGDRAMGQLHIARLDKGEGVPLLPVDVAAWQTEATPEIMALLHQSARASYPLRGYPRELVMAHEHAHLSGLEIELLQRLLLAQLDKHDPNAGRQGRLMWLLGKQLVEDFDNERTNL